MPRLELNLKIINQYNILYSIDEVNFVSVSGCRGPSRFDGKEPMSRSLRSIRERKWSQPMSNSSIVESILPSDQCSRTEFQAQRERVADLLRDAGRAALRDAAVADDDLRRAEVSLEQDVARRLQQLILRAKGIVSEEILVRHQREIPVDEIPDYAVTHLLLELSERELRSGAE